MMKTKLKILVFALGGISVAACQSTSGGVGSSNAVDLVIQEVKVANSVSELCSGGEASIRPAIGAAVGKLASAQQISGNYNAIGESAGQKFAETECQ